MPNKGSATIITLVVFLALVVGVGIYVYTEIDSPLFGRFFSEGKQKEREVKRLRKNFPDSIGGYILYERNPEKIRVTSECERVEDHPDTKSSGIIGEICYKTATGQYRNTSSDKVIFVHLHLITKGGDISKALHGKFSKPDNIGDYEVFRVENHEIGWFPLHDFHVIMTQEGRWKAGADGSESFSYQETATGNNPVTKYFLNKFPPGISDPRISSETPQQSKSAGEI